MAERALPVAAWLATETGVPINLLRVVADPARSPEAIGSRSAANAGASPCTT
jgi:hypothetical protein